MDVVSCIYGYPRACLPIVNGIPCFISSCLMAKGLSGAGQQLVTRILNVNGNPGLISSCFMVEREHRPSHVVSCIYDDPRARLPIFNGITCLISSCLMVKGVSGAGQQL